MQWLQEPDTLVPTGGGGGGPVTNNGCNTVAGC